METKKLRWVLFITLVGIVAVYFSIPFLNDNLKSLEIKSLIDITDYGTTGNKMPDKVIFSVEFNKNLGNLGVNDVEIDIGYDEKADIITIKKMNETRVSSIYNIEIKRSKLIDNMVSITKVRHRNKVENIQKNNIIEFKSEEIIKNIEYDFSEKIYTDSDEVELNLFLESKFKINISKILLKNNLELELSGADLEGSEYEYVSDITFINRFQDINKYTFRLKLDKTKERIINLEEIHFSYEKETHNSTVVMTSKRILSEDEKVVISSEFEDTYILKIPEMVTLYNFEEEIILPIELKSNKKLGTNIHLDYVIKKTNGEAEHKTFNTVFSERLDFNITFSVFNYGEVEEVIFKTLKYEKDGKLITYNLEGYETMVKNTESNIFDELSVNENKYYLNQETYAALTDLPDTYSFEKIFAKVDSTEFELQFRLDGKLMILRDNLTTQDFKNMNDKDIKISRVILTDHRIEEQVTIEEDFFQDLSFGKMRYIDLEADVKFKINEDINVLDKNSDNLILYGESPELLIKIENQIYDNKNNIAWGEDLTLTYVNFRFVNENNIFQKRDEFEIKGDMQKQFEYMADFKGFFGSFEIESLVYTIKGNHLNNEDTQHTLRDSSDALKLSVESDRVHYISDENLNATSFDIVKERTAIIYQNIGDEVYQIDHQYGDKKFKFKDDLVKYGLNFKYSDNYFKIEHNGEFINDEQEKQGGTIDEYFLDEEYILLYKLYVMISGEAYYLKDFEETTIASEDDLNFVDLSLNFDFEHSFNLDDIILLSGEENDNITGTFSLDFELFRNALTIDYENILIEIRVKGHLKKEEDEVFEYILNKNDDWLYRGNIRENSNNLLIGEEIILEKITFLDDGDNAKSRIVEGYSLIDKRVDVSNRSVLTDYELNTKDVRYDGSTYFFSYKLTNLFENKELSPFALNTTGEFNLRLKKNDKEYSLTDFYYREDLTKNEAMLSFKFKDKIEELSVIELNELLNGIELIYSSENKGG